MLPRSRALDIGGGQRRAKRPIRITLNWQSMLALLGLFAIGYSTKSWYDIQIKLYPTNPVFALLLSFGIALGAPALLSMLIPLTAGGMLWQKVTRQTFGFIAVVLMTGFYLYYCYDLLLAWNGAQKVVAASGLVYKQTVMQMIIYIGIPAICFTPISHERLVAVVEQHTYVKKYELETIGMMMILEATVKRAYELALRGVADLVADEREELAGVFTALVNGQQESLEATGQLVEKASGVALPGVPFQEEMGDLLNLAGMAIMNRIPAAEAGEKVAQQLKRIKALTAQGRPRQTVTRQLQLQEAERIERDEYERRPRRDDYDDPDRDNLGNRRNRRTRRID